MVESNDYKEKSMKKSTNLTSIIGVDFSDWAMEEFAELAHYYQEDSEARKDGFPAFSKERFKAERAKAVKEGRNLASLIDIRRSQSKLEEERFNEVYNGYSRSKLREQLVSLVQEYLTDPDNCSDLARLAVGYHPLNGKIAFPKSTKDTYSFAANEQNIPQALEAIARACVIGGKPIKPCTLMYGVKEDLGRELVFGEDAEIEHLVDFVDEAPFHWAEMWSLYKNRAYSPAYKDGKHWTDIPNLLVAVLLFEQKYGYYPSIEPSGRTLSTMLKTVQKPFINYPFCKGAPKAVAKDEQQPLFDRFHHLSRSLHDPYNISEPDSRPVAKPHDLVAEYDPFG